MKKSIFLILIHFLNQGFCQRKLQDKHVEMDSLVNHVFLELIYSSKLEFQEEWQSAMKKINRVIDMEPDMAEGYYYRGVMKGYVKHFEGRIRDFDKALDINPNYTLALIQRSAAHMHANEPLKALEDLNKAIQIGQRLGWCYNNRGDIYLTMKMHSEACNSYNLALEQGYIVEEDKLLFCK